VLGECLIRNRSRRLLLEGTRRRKVKTISIRGKQGPFLVVINSWSPVVSWLALMTSTDMEHPQANQICRAAKDYGLDQGSCPVPVSENGFWYTG
jgi:hypothetical protein